LLRKAPTQSRTVHLHPPFLMMKMIRIFTKHARRHAIFSW
jgi:hypothetical protein